MAAALVYFLFFCSGISGLVYQVVWVREFATVFGNTIYSSAIVVAIFMLGLGVGSYVAGNWADRRYAAAPASLLRVYGFVELLIAALALAVVRPRRRWLVRVVITFVRRQGRHRTRSIGSRHPADGRDVDAARSPPG